MEFQSPGFLFVLLPFVVLVVFLLRKRLRLRNLFLAGASYLFYSGAEPTFCLLLFASSLVDYTVALWLSRATQTWKRRFLLGLSLSCNLSLLAFFKYGGFFFALPIAGNDFLPPGISFYTFQTLAYTIDVYRRRVHPTRDFTGFAVFVSFLPQLIAGPIERFDKLQAQLTVRTLPFTVENFWYGMNRLSTGLLLKVLLADPCGRTVDGMIEAGTHASLLEAWLVVAAFGVQIYADFCGYSHMAIGIASMMGIRLSENFNRPYRAGNIQEFWHRWHMTLSQWFRDYVYIPLGGNRHGVSRTAMNVFLTFALCGLWHGAGWNFVIWGVLHGIAQGIYVVSAPLRTRFPVPRVLGTVFTYAVVHFLWVVFRVSDPTVAASLIKNMAGLGRWASSDLPVWDLAYVSCALGLLILLPDRLSRWFETCRRPFLCGTVWAVSLLLVLQQPEVRTFIYFRF